MSRSKNPASRYVEIVRKSKLRTRDYIAKFEAGDDLCLCEIRHRDNHILLYQMKYYSSLATLKKSYSMTLAKSNSNVERSGNGY